MTAGGLPATFRFSRTSVIKCAFEEVAACHEQVF